MAPQQMLTGHLTPYYAQLKFRIGVRTYSSPENTTELLTHSTTTVLTQSLVVLLTVRDNRETTKQTTSNSDYRQRTIYETWFARATGYSAVLPAGPPPDPGSNIEFEHGFWREAEVFYSAEIILSQSIIHH